MVHTCTCITKFFMRTFSITSDKSHQFIYGHQNSQKWKSDFKYCTPLSGLHSTWKIRARFSFSAIFLHNAFASELFPLPRLPVMRSIPLYSPGVVTLNILSAKGLIPRQISKWAKALDTYSFTPLKQRSTRWCTCIYRREIKNGSLIQNRDEYNAEQSWHNHNPHGTGTSIKKKQFLTYPVHIIFEHPCSHTGLVAYKDTKTLTSTLNF